MPAVDDLATTKYVYATVTNDGQPDVPAMMITTINADRVGDRVLPEGGVFTNFLRNPVLLWSHGGAAGYSSVPIGTVSSIEVLPGKGVRASWNWLKNDPFAERIANGWRQGAIRACSIGFKPLKATPNGAGLDHEAWELYELSICAIPMNAECVKTIKSLLDLELPAQKAEAEPEPEQKADMGAKSMASCLEHLAQAIGMHEVHMAEPQSATPESQAAMMAHLLAAQAACAAAMGMTAMEGKAVQKRGRVLSAVNESKLRAAVTSLSDATRVLAEVLAQLEAVKPADDMPMEEPEHPRELMHDPEEYALVLADEAPLLRLLLAEEPDDDVIVCSLVDDPQQEPTISIDADDLRRAIADVMREQLQAAIVEPVTAHLHRSLDFARGRVH